jgi:hypothetical protein
MGAALMKRLNTKFTLEPALLAVRNVVTLSPSCLRPVDFAIRTLTDILLFFVRKSEVVPMQALYH